VSFAFRADETVEQGVRRIVARQLDALIEIFSRKKRMSQFKAAHEARKRLKKLRALLRLVHGALGDKAFKKHDKLFRNAGRTLSPFRDASVLLTSFDQLLAHFHHRPSSAALKAIRSHLLKQRRKVMQGNHYLSGLRHAIKHLRSAKRDSRRWKLKCEGWPAVRSGLQKTYQDGRKAFRAAENNPRDYKLHEWRKRGKDLRHQLELLSELWPRELQMIVDEARQLGDWLGDDHDLAVLRETLAGDGVQAIEPLIEGRRKQLQAEAILLGSRLYRRKPADFVKRIHDQLPKDEVARNIFQCAPIDR
jgi:CHAD domain-containing protein